MKVRISAAQWKSGRVTISVRTMLTVATVIFDLSSFEAALNLVTNINMFIFRNVLGVLA